MVKFLFAFLLFLFFILPYSAFADDANDITKVRKSLHAQARIENNLGHSHRAKMLLSIEQNIAENVSSGNKAYVIKTKINEGKYDEAFLMSIGYEMPKKSNKIDYRQNKAIFKNCEKKWGDDYSMIKYCIEKQLKSRQKVLSYPRNNIRTNCEKKWGDDFSMVGYCIKKQSDAKKAIYK